MNEIDTFISQQAALLYGVKHMEENTNGASGNRIFAVKTAQEAFMLRVCPFSPKVQARVAFEVHWLDYLSQQCHHIAKPIPSAGGKLYEVTGQGKQALILCLFEKAQGKSPDSSNPQEFNEALFFNLGAVMGDMHRLTIPYKGNRISPAFAWDNNADSWRGNSVILDQEVQRWERRYWNEIHTLPITKESYGIIHYDTHIDNFFVKDNKIKLFDFYDCQFNWYAADIASAIFFMVQKGVGPLPHKSEKERTEFAEAYIISYLKGYQQTNSICPYWVNTLDLFMKFQMTDEYRCAQDYWKKEQMHLQQWYLDWHKNKIITNTPYVTVNYKKILGSIPQKSII